MTAFPSFAFAATGSPTPRTLPDRLAEIKNVKDFGAIGDGVADDWPAIMAAFNWTVVARTNRGTIYFPPGTYRVSQPIDFSGVAVSSHWLGNLGASTIVGNFADYVLKRGINDTDSQSGGHVVEKLTVINSHPNGCGIRLGQSVGAAIRDCVVTANQGINTANTDNKIANAYWGSLEVSIENCTVSPGANTAGSQGILAFADGPVLNCRIVGFDVGMKIWGGQGAQVIMGCYFEGNGIGFSPGVAPDGTADSASDYTLSGCWFKNNGTAILNPRGPGTIRGIRIEGAQGGVPGGGNPQYGIRTTASGLMTFVAMQGVIVSGWFDIAGISITGGEVNNPQNTFLGIVSTNTSTAPGAVAWSAISSAMSVRRLGCNVAPVCTVSQLPVKTFTVTAATWLAGTATLTFSGGHGASGFTANATIAGISPAGFNGFFVGGVDGTATGCTTSGTTLTMGVLATGKFQVGDTLAGNDGVLGHSLSTQTIVAQLTGVPGGSAGATFQMSAAATGGDLTAADVTARIIAFPTFNTMNYALASNPGSFVSGGTAVVNILSDAGEYNAWEGDAYDVTDASSTTWGAIPAGGGAGHDKARWNGQNWTVMGK